MDGKELVVRWLNDALGMETSLIQVLQHRIKDAKDYPDLRAMDEQHLEETRRHAEMVKGCLARLGESPSTLKTVMGTITGTLQAPMTEFAKDEVIKNCLTDYAAENFEVASYRSLIAAASEIGDQETATVCERIMQEDQAMADRILQSIPMVTVAEMQRLANES
jgi:ferritin-like metal-binding protein YciE